MKLASNVNIRGIMGRELVEVLRPTFMGRSVARASDMRDVLNDFYSPQGKDFTEQDVLRLWEKAGAEPSRMLEANRAVLLLDSSNNHSLWCLDPFCPRCHPGSVRPKPETDYRADPGFINDQRRSEEEVYNEDPSDRDTGIVDPARQMADDQEREVAAYGADEERTEIQTATLEEIGLPNAS
jgi:hypothetical protein